MQEMAGCDQKGRGDRGAPLWGVGLRGMGPWARAPAGNGPSWEVGVIRHRDTA